MWDVLCDGIVNSVGFKAVRWVFSRGGWRAGVEAGMAGQGAGVDCSGQVGFYFAGVK